MQSHPPRHTTPRRHAGGIGAYSDSKGLPIVRQEFSDFLKRRDGFAADIDNVFLCNGASEAVRLVLQCVHSLYLCNDMTTPATSYSTSCNSTPTHTPNPTGL